MDEKATRVVFRKEKDAFHKGKVNYLAVFPDSKAAPGKVTYNRFYFNGDGSVVFESVGEMSLNYYYTTTIVHKNSDDSDDAEKCLKAASEYLDTPLTVVEKLRTSW